MFLAYPRVIRARLLKRSLERGWRLAYHGQRITMIRVVSANDINLGYRGKFLIDEQNLGMMPWNVFG